MPPKKHIITIGVLCVIALGSGYWVGLPKEGSGGGGNGEGKGETAAKIPGSGEGKSGGDNTPDSLKQGLVAYYPFNGNAKDESGNGHHGTVNGAMLTTDRYGSASKAYNFDGEDDQLNCPFTGIIESNFSFSFWAKPNSMTIDLPERHSRIFVQGNHEVLIPYVGGDKQTGKAGIGVDLGVNGFYIMEHADDHLPTTLAYKADLTGWKHYVVVVQNNRPVLFVNGHFVHKGSQSGKTVIWSSVVRGKKLHPESVGNMRGIKPFARGAYKGDMDQFRIYNRALSEAEVKELYEFEKPKTQQASTAKPPVVVTNVVPPDPKPEPPLEEKKIVAPPTFTSNPSNPQNVIVEAAICKALGKNAGQLTKADLEEVTGLNLNGTKISDAGLKEVAKLTHLERLELDGSTVQISDAGLMELAKLPKLTHLSLWTSQITDAGLKEVAKLQRLTYLHLGRCTLITDKGLKEMAKLKQLRELSLWRTQITDVGLREVAKLHQLSTINLNFTKVTKAGVAELRKAMPKCAIFGP